MCNHVLLPTTGMSLSSSTPRSPTRNGEEDEEEMSKYVWEKRGRTGKDGGTTSKHKKQKYKTQPKKHKA